MAVTLRALPLNVYCGTLNKMTQSVRDGIPMPSGVEPEKKKRRKKDMECLIQ